MRRSLSGSTRKTAPSGATERGFVRLARFARLFPLLLSLLLLACLGGDDGEGPLSYTEYITEIDREAQTYTTLDDSWYCEDGRAVQVEEEYTTNYSVRGGELFRWGDDDCRASVMSGSSSDLVGTWKASPPKLTQIPGGDDDCSPRDLEFENVFYGFSRNLKATEKITETRIHASATGDMCYGEMFAWISVWNLGPQDAFEVTQGDCSAATVTRLEDDATGRFEAHLKGSTMTLKFTGNGETCAATMPQGGGEMDCTKEDPEDAFDECVRESGFFGTDNFEKKSSESVRKARAAMRHALRRAR